MSLVSDSEWYGEPHTLIVHAVTPPDGPFDVLVIDPPWPMERIKRECRPNQTASVDYPTMTLAAIEGLGAAVLLAQVLIKLLVFPIELFDCNLGRKKTFLSFSVSLFRQ